jgi:hypothetical protein
LETRAGIFVRRVQIVSDHLEKNLQTLPLRANSRKSIFAKYTHWPFQMADATFVSHASHP